MDVGVIRVKTFGDFSISDDQGHVVTSEDMRSTVMTKFLMYLLIHRDHMNGKDELIESLWYEGEVENPAGALKNITYRVRTFLNQNFGEREYILSSRGGYAWNEDVPVVLDLEELESCYDRAMNHDLSAEERFPWCEKIVNLYQGTFGQKIGGMIWAANLSMYYQTRYLNVVSELIELYKEAGECQKIIALANQALNYDPLNEGLYCDLIDALVVSNQRPMAEDVYDAASRLLYEELGMRNPKRLTEAHEKILKMSKGTKSDTILEVCNDIEEECVEGAFFCGYPVFREIYRLEARKIARLGNAEYVVLFSLESHKASHGANISKADEFMMNKSMRRFEQVLDYSLRVGDVVARYSDLQYIVLLSSCSYESSKNVADRIISKFNSGNNNADLEWKYSLEEVAMDSGAEHVEQYSKASSY